ncbi:hypothetical protein LTR66_017124, partial [Elasticomyces elasticus]
ERREHQLRQAREDEELAADLASAIDAESERQRRRRVSLAGYSPHPHVVDGFSDITSISDDIDDSDAQTPQSTQSTQTRSQAQSQRTIPSQTATNLDTQTTAMEPIDLTSDDAVAQQKVATLVANQPSISTPTAVQGTPFSSYKCSVCMDTPDNATTTICGHLFCHKCIFDALKYSLNTRRQEGLVGRARSGQGLCPACRKPLHIRDVGTHRGLIPLELKLVKRKDYEAQKEKEHKQQEVGNSIVEFSKELGGVTVIDNADGAIAAEDVDVKGKKKKSKGVRAGSRSVKIESEPEQNSSTTRAIRKRRRAVDDEYED